MINYTTLFIEYDALFDMRLALLYRYGDEAVSLALTPEYFNRIADKFPKIQYSEYHELYKARDRSLVADSVINTMIEMISDFVYGVVKNSINGPTDSVPKIILNTYPYLLLEEEKENLKEALIGYTKTYAEVEVVHMSTKELTPMYVKDNVDILILYDYIVWLEEHSKSELFKKVQIPAVTLFGPKIHFLEPDVNLLAEFSRNKVDPFKVLEERAAPIIGLKLLPIHLFSLNVTPDLTPPVSDAK